MLLVSLFIAEVQPPLATHAGCECLPLNQSGTPADGTYEFPGNFARKPLFPSFDNHITEQMKLFNILAW